ncbi:hypothetical protein P8C59_000846 [Phyllachora maydis]|uniref:Uncharacterized protein n=1 Tax=Phyllachora maydis TaxID=1825666 RepID=A0AAD9MBM3_9PEZI|nr:hypothetical protein P8C59_000846 [Phyllachora maydis]
MLFVLPRTGTALRVLLLLLLLGSTHLATAFPLARLLSPFVPKGLLPERPERPDLLQHDDVIVLHEDGSSTVMKEWDLTNMYLHAEQVEKQVAQAMAAAAAAAANASAHDRRRSDTSLGVENSRRHHDHGPGGCEASDELQLVTDNTLLDWDKEMSRVISAEGGPSTITLQSGFSLSDSQTYTAYAEFAPIKALLNLGLATSSTTTWTTINTQTWSFSVPAGQFGIIVSQPIVRRRTGFLLYGCTDDWQRSAFEDNRYFNASAGGFDWPKGTIRLCNSTEYPIPFCRGVGYHQ